MPTTSSSSIDDMIESLHAPRWADSAQNPAMSPVKLDCITNGVPGTFNASPNDTEEYGRTVWADCIAGKYGPIGLYVAPIVTVEQTMGTTTQGAMDYFQGVMAPLPPGDERQLFYTEIQAAFTVNGTYMAKIKPPWNRAVTAEDQALFDQGEAAIQETIDYLNNLPPPTTGSRKQLPPFKSQRARMKEN